MMEQISYLSPLFFSSLTENVNHKTYFTRVFVKQQAFNKFFRFFVYILGYEK